MDHCGFKKWKVQVLVMAGEKQANFLFWEQSSAAGHLGLRA